MDTTLNRYQASARAFAKYPGAGTGSLQSLSYCALGLAGEAGEVSNQLKKVLRAGREGIGDTPGMRELLVEELGDVLWYCAGMAGELKVSLEEVGERNLRKLGKRLEAGTLCAEGKRDAGKDVG